MTTQPQAPKKTPYLKLQMASLILIGLSVIGLGIGILFFFSSSANDQDAAGPLLGASIQLFVMSSILWVLTDLGQRAYNKGTIGES